MEDRRLTIASTRGVICSITSVWLVLHFPKDGSNRSGRTPSKRLQSPRKYYLAHGISAGS